MHRAGETLVGPQPPGLGIALWGLRKGKEAAGSDLQEWA